LRLETWGLELEGTAGGAAVLGFTALRGGGSGEYVWWIVECAGPLARFGWRRLKGDVDFDETPYMIIDIYE
jgi:hypothetical protein